MSSDWVVVTISVTAAVVSATGAIVSAQLAVRGERKRSAEDRAEDARLEAARWTRDRRADLYVRIMVLHGRALFDLPILEPTAEAALKARRRREQNFRALRDVVGGLQAFGSREVMALADDLGKLIEHAQSPKDVDQAVISPAWEKLANAIRAELATPD